MRLRDYQARAVDAIYKAWEDSDSTLAVMPTGCGKTITFAHVIDRLPPGRRAMLIAHREELIFQGADKIARVTGEAPDVEMAEFRADRGAWLVGATKKQVVVASVQTLNAGAGEGRMGRFDPQDFGLLIIDEAHHAVAKSYQAVIEWFRKNPRLKVLGVTATPDRADEMALGQVFDSVAFDYEIADAITDGWLVPIEQQMVHVEGLDLSSVRTTAGDLNGADLAHVMEYESNLHEIASPTLEICGGRKALVFAASVAHAERLCEIFNRHHAACARWVCGETPKEERRSLFADYADGKFQFLCNVGVATEGFDDPSIQVVVMARPTKSRALYAQMAGRGTRPLPGLVDSQPMAEHRRAAIAASAKPAVLIVDFVGNAGKHKLMSTADILGGNYPDEVVEQAARTVREAGQSKDMLEALAEAQAELRKQAEETKAREAATRARLRAKAVYSTSTVSPFDLFHLAPRQERGWDVGRQLSEKQRALLEKHMPGVDVDALTYSQGKQLLDEQFRRWDTGECSYKQAKLLARNHLPTNVSRTQAKEWIDQIAANKWRLPESLKPMTQQVEVEVF
jgi:superfamily II DNA or RNA helicase